MLNILQRYILREVAGPALMGLIAFTFMLFAAEMFELMRELLQLGVSWQSIALLLSNLMPSLLAQSIPMALLVGVFMGFGRLSSELEIMAMRTSGVSVWKLYAPALLASSIIAGGLIALNVDFFPSLNRQLKEVVNRIEFEGMANPAAGRLYNREKMGGDVEDYDFEFVYSERLPGQGPDGRDLMVGPSLAIYNRDKVDENQTGRKSGSNTLIVAKRGYIDADPATRGFQFVFLDGQAYSWELGRPQRSQIMDFTEMRRNFQRASLLGSKPREQSTADLIAGIQKPGSPDRIGGLRVELFSRFSIPLAAFTFVWFAMPLAVLIRPKTRTASYCLTIAVIFFYYVLIKLGEGLGADNNAMIPVAIFAPNVALLLAGGILMLKTART